MSIEVYLNLIGALNEKDRSFSSVEHRHANG